MWPFRKPFSKAETEALLLTCNFQLARQELAAFFRMSAQEAASRGAQAAFRTEFVEGWEKFAAKPCRDTAAEWLAQAPEYKQVILRYFGECSPAAGFGSFDAIHARFNPE